MDAELVRRGLVASRESARRLIVEREVLVDGAFAEKPARMVDPAQAITFVGKPPPFVSRAGNKLAGALDEFSLAADGLYCLDAGSSTGGFSDCLLQRGASHVVAVDVGTNQLHEKIRNDTRVTVMEQTDVRSLSPDMFERSFDLIVGDLSFISLRLVLPSLVALSSDSAALVLLVKPQFEAGRQEAARGKGIITDPSIWRRVLTSVLASAVENGLTIKAVTPSSLPGSGGNIEFVTWLERDSSTISVGELNVETMVDDAVDRASGSD